MPAAIYRERYRAAGMCQSCGRNRPAEGIATCAVCMGKSVECNRQRDRRRERDTHLKPQDLIHCERCHLRGHTQHECDLRRPTR
jgi:hypothetical protein